MSEIRDLLINGIAASYLCPRKCRRILYMLFGLKVQTSRISPHCFFGGNKISIGKNTFINYNNFFDLSDCITIGNNVRIAMCSRFITSTHKIGSSEMRGGVSKTAPIRIEDGCWIGANVTILPGVTIKAGTVIAAGAVVIHDCDENALYGGVPAKKIRDLQEY